MAPIPVDSVDDKVRNVIQDLFEIQTAVHGYLGPETQQTLIKKIHQTTESLASLSANASTITTEVPPEVIEYIDEGRNPDIYTREFVELVQKNNSDLKGKSESFARFREILAEDMMDMMPEKKAEIQKVRAGGPVHLEGTSQ